MATKTRRSRKKTAAAAAEDLARARENVAKARRALAKITTLNDSPTVILGGAWKPVAKAIELRRKALLRIPGVVACGVGHKVVGGVETDEPALVVFVQRKLARNEIAAARTRLLPRYVIVNNYRVPVDVVELQPPEPHGSLGSIGPTSAIDAATIGAVARDATTGQAVLITAMHAIGSGPCIDPQPVPAVSFTVPALRDMPGAPIIGSLADGTTFGVDAAKIAVTSPSLVVPFVPPLRIVGWRPPSNDVGISVTMFGKNSGFQDGVVKYIDVTIPQLCLERTLLVSIFSQPGDSGAGLVDSASILLGFLFGFAPSQFGPFRVFCPASLVLPRLGCAIP